MQKMKLYRFDFIEEGECIEITIKIQRKMVISKHEIYG